MSEMNGPDAASPEAQNECDVSRRQMLTKGAKFAAFVTPAMMVLVPPQRADACKGNGNAQPNGPAHGYYAGCST